MELIIYKGFGPCFKQEDLKYFFKYSFFLKLYLKMISQYLTSFKGQNNLWNNMFNIFTFLKCEQG